MTTIGYARVSTTDQNPDAQTDQLTAYGCEKLFIDTTSGTLSARPSLTMLLDYVRAGDTVVVTKLDRLGRSVKHLEELSAVLSAKDVALVAISQGIDTTSAGGRLFFHMLAAIAEFEHDLIVERTKDGLSAARARGRKGGAKQKVTPLMAEQMRAMYEKKDVTAQDVADAFGVSRATVYRYGASD